MRPAKCEHICNGYVFYIEGTSDIKLSYTSKLLCIKICIKNLVFGNSSLTPYCTHAIICTNCHKCCNFLEVQIRVYPIMRLDL